MPRHTASGFAGSLCRAHRSLPAALRGHLMGWAGSGTCARTSGSPARGEGSARPDDAAGRLGRPERTLAFLPACFSAHALTSFSFWT